MVKKVLQSGLELSGIAPNILLKHVESTVPYLFRGELDSSGSHRAYLERLIYYKKNLDKLKNLDLDDYFYLCMAAHWATAGSFVPTDVDNQIREGLWKHKKVQKYIKTMAQITIDSWKWDYEQVTNRKSYNLENFQMISTHEGTWLSVAIGAYCALIKYQITDLAQAMAEVILQEIKKEELLLLDLRKNHDHINFLRTCALMAHNFGDLDRVMDQWQMNPADEFHQRIYKLGHKLNSHYSPILVYAGQVNKEFLALENHRHMSMRGPKCLRRSFKFLIPVGPFMDDWGMTLGKSTELTLPEKGELVCAFWEGFTRQDQAFGYARAYKGLVEVLPNGLKTLEQDIPFDIIHDIKKSNFSKIAETSREVFEANYCKRLDQFICPITSLKF